MINKKRLIKLTQALIRINSENPPGRESEIAKFIAKRLNRFGVKTRFYEFKKGRVNVVARLGGSDSSRELLITPHLDTVSAGTGWSVGPFSGVLRSGRVYGRGATDCKCNIAVAIEAIESLVEDGARLGYDLVFAPTADEEAGSGLGLIPLLDKGIMKPDAALVLDSDDFAVMITQKGMVHLKVRLFGKSAHGAYPERGTNAIDAAIKILSELKTKRRPFRKNKYLKPPTLNIGTIRGGDRVNIVASWCEFELDFRYLPGQRSRDIISDLRKTIRKYSRKFKIEVYCSQRDYALDPSHNLVGSFVDSLRHFGVKPKISGSEGATTITLFQDKKIPAIASGFGVDGCAHTVDEYVTTDNLYKGAKVLEHFLRTYSFDRRRKDL